MADYNSDVRARSLKIFVDADTLLLRDPRDIAYIDKTSRMIGAVTTGLSKQVTAVMNNMNSKSVTAIKKELADMLDKFANCPFHKQSKHAIEVFSRVKALGDHSITILDTLPERFNFPGIKSPIKTTLNSREGFGASTYWTANNPVVCEYSCKDQVARIKEGSADVYVGSDPKTCMAAKKSGVEMVFYLPAYSDKKHTFADDIKERKLKSLGVILPEPAKYHDSEKFAPLSYVYGDIVWSNFEHVLGQAIQESSNNAFGESTLIERNVYDDNYLHYVMFQSPVPNKIQYYAYNPKTQEPERKVDAQAVESQDTVTVDAPIPTDGGKPTGQGDEQ